MNGSGLGIDRLARELAAGRSRRAVVRALAGGAAGGLLAALGGRGAGAAGTKVPICHLTGSAATPYAYLLVSDVPNGPHSRHAGDAINVDLLTDPDHCGACGNACDAWEICVAGSCQGCGGGGQACCAGQICGPGLACNGGTCEDGCGGPCTADPDCCAGLTCCDGTCQNDNCDGLD